MSSQYRRPLIIPVIELKDQESNPSKNKRANREQGVGAGGVDLRKECVLAAGKGC